MKTGTNRDGATLCTFCRQLDLSKAAEDLTAVRNALYCNRPVDSEDDIPDSRGPRPQCDDIGIHIASVGG